MPALHPAPPPSSFALCIHGIVHPKSLRSPLMAQHTSHAFAECAAHAPRCPSTVAVACACQPPASSQQGVPLYARMHARPGKQVQVHCAHPAWAARSSNSPATLPSCSMRLQVPPLHRCRAQPPAMQPAPQVHDAAARVHHTCMAHPGVLSLSLTHASSTCAQQLRPPAPANRSGVALQGAWMQRTRTTIPASIMRQQHACAGCCGQAPPPPPTTL